MALDKNGDGRSAYSAKPSSLNGPVPGEAAVQEAQAAVQPSKLDAFKSAAGLDQAKLAAFGQAAGINTTEVPLESVETIPDEMPNERFARIGNPLQATKEMVGDQLARFRASWAVSDKQKKGLLTKIYGEKGVRQSSDGTFQIRRPGEKGFRDFDPDTGAFSLDVMGDVLDLSRDVTEGAFELGGRIGGGMMGAAEAAPAGMIAGAPAGPLGSAAGGVTTGLMGAMAGQAVGGAAGATIGFNVGDFIAENLVGIERDPDRNRGKETAMVGGIAAGIGTVFGLASGTLARMRIAREARKATTTPQDVLQTAKEIEIASDSLARNGINLRQGKMVLSPGQVAGDLMPEAGSLDHALSDIGQVRDFFNNQGKLLANGWSVLQQGISNVTGKPAEELFQAVKKASKTSREVEGKTIGSFRTNALRQTRGEPQNVLRTRNTVGEYSFLKTSSLEDLQLRFPDASPTVLGKTKALYSDLEKSLAKHGGQLPLNEVDRIYGSFRDTIDNFWGTKAGGDVAIDLVKLKDALRDDWADSIGSVLNKYDPEALPSYKASMQKYSDIMSAQKTLAGVLKKNDLSAAAFADQIFSPSQGKDRVRQLKTLIDDADPTLWPQLVNQKLELAREAATNQKTGRIDWGKLSGEIDKLEKAEVLDQMVGTPENKKNLKDFFTIARQVDSQFKFKEADLIDTRGPIAQSRHLLVLAAKQVSALARLSAGQNMAQGIIDGIGKDRAYARWLQGEGLELVIRGLPKQEQSLVRKYIPPMLEMGNAAFMARQRRNAITPEPGTYANPTETEKAPEGFEQ